MPFGVDKKKWDRWTLRGKATYLAVLVGIPIGLVLLFVLASFLTQGMTSIQLWCCGLVMMFGLYLLKPR